MGKFNDVKVAALKALKKKWDETRYEEVPNLEVHDPNPEKDDTTPVTESESTLFTPETRKKFEQDYKKRKSVKEMFDNFKKSW